MSDLPSAIEIHEEGRVSVREGDVFAGGSNSARECSIAQRAQANPGRIFRESETHPTDGRYNRTLWGDQANLCRGVVGPDELPGGSARRYRGRLRTGRAYPARSALAARRRHGGRYAGRLVYRRFGLER